MEFYHLRYFVAVAEALSFHRAAERLNMCQPPLSRQIRLLEEELGVRLLERSRGSRISLTDAGKTFLADARKMLGAPEAARQRAREAANGAHGQLVFASHSALVNPLLGDCLKAFRRRHPKVKVLFLDLDASEHPAALRTGRIDAGVTVSFDPEQNEYLQYLHLLDLRLFVGFSPEHPLAGAEGEIDIHELAGEVLLCPQAESSSCYAHCLKDLCTKANFKPVEIRQVEGMGNIVNMAIAGYGVAVLPSLANAEQDPSVVRSRPLKMPPVPLQLGLYSLRGNSSLALQNFLVVARRVLEQKGTQDK